MNGAFKACCKNPTDFGQWQKDGLDRIWFSEQYQAFRKDIVEGRYPDAYCETCCLNGSSQSLRQLLQKPLQEYARNLEEHYPAGIHHIGRLRSILEPVNEARMLKRLRAELNVRVVLAKYRLHLRKCSRLVRAGKLPEALGITIAKLMLIARIVEDFLMGNLNPAAVAPLRQANLISICNARCIHCPGLFSDEIVKGKKMPGGGYFKEMSEGDVEKCFEAEEHIIDFFMNGSEFLFGKTWPLVAERLKKQGVKARVSTNGMLLTEQNARLLIDNGYLGKLNLSLDGGTKETIERIRQRVDFDRVVKNLTFLLEYAAEKDYSFPFSMTFVLMDINYGELAEFVRLAERFHKINPKIRPSIMVQPLARKGVQGYADFVAGHHPALVEKATLDAVFQEMLEQSRASGITVFVFFTWRLEEFIKKGCPIPPSDVVVGNAAALELED